MLDEQNDDRDQSLLKAEMVTTIVSAYLSNNAVEPGAIGDLISQVSAGLDNMSHFGDMQPEAKSEPQEPAVSIKKSITPDYLISLETGRKLKSLKRYLRTSHNMTPEEYRAKWNLPKDYPMVAPNYAKARSDLAKAMGLGTGGPGKPPARKGTSAKATAKATAPKGRKGGKVTERALDKVGVRDNDEAKSADA